mmetsp:Transcript_6494/g.16638  ORF Transcript_6494/g.16638 Transcript_6494/m.16638 type:complete len:221 (+) Transcript_6494:115-777(+)
MATTYRRERLLVAKTTISSFTCVFIHGACSNCHSCGVVATRDAPSLVLYDTSAAHNVLVGVFEVAVGQARHSCINFAVCTSKRHCAARSHVEAVNAGTVCHARICVFSAAVQGADGVLVHATEMAGRVHSGRRGCWYHLRWRCRVAATTRCASRDQEIAVRRICTSVIRDGASTVVEPSLVNLETIGTSIDLAVQWGVDEIWWSGVLDGEGCCRANGIAT